MKLQDYYKNTKDRSDACGFKEGGPSHEEDDGQLLSSVKALPDLRGSWLDIGCQSGNLIAKLGSRFDEVHGVDIGDYSSSWEKLSHAKIRIHDLDSEPLPFPPESFDVFGVLQEIGRVTKPSGYVVIEVPNASYIKHIISLLKGVVPRTAAQAYPFSEKHGWDGQHLHSFTIKDLTEGFGRFGLRPIQHTTRGRFPKLRRIAPSLLYSSLILSMQKLPEDS